MASPYACSKARCAALRCGSASELCCVSRAVAEPSAEQVAALLARFISEMQALFERHKAKAGYPDLKLVVL